MCTWGSALAAQARLKLNTKARARRAQRMLVIGILHSAGFRPWGDSTVPADSGIVVAGIRALKLSQGINSSRRPSGWSMRSPFKNKRRSLR
nr:hypothetical protein FFPRI1PSEUD_34610 [Pseudomonas sp. FFPRI_1]